LAVDLLVEPSGTLFMLVTTKRGLSFGSRLGCRGDFRLIKDATLVLPVFFVCSGTLHRRVRSLPLFLDRRRTARMAARPNTHHNTHWRPGSRHIPHEAGGLETQNLRRRKPPIQAHAERALRENAGIQTPKQAAKKIPIAPAGAGTLPGRTRRQPNTVPPSR